MITARKNAAFERFFSIYNRNLFKRRFADFRVSGLNQLRERDKQIPLVLYANHSSWWDPLVVFEISRKTQTETYAMMDEQNLRKLQFFRLIGAFSVARENPRTALKSIRYAVNLLKEKPARAVLIFPQGEILPNDARPFKFYNGLARIIEQSNVCLAAPIAMRFEFLNDFKPEAFAAIGKPEIYANVANGKQLTASLAEKLGNTLDELKKDILAKSFDNFERM